MTNLIHLRRPLFLALGLTAALALAGCSQTSNTPTASPSASATPSAPTSATTPASATTPSSASASPSASPSPASGKRIDITVKGKQVTPNPTLVNLAVGESLTIAITSDKANTLHGHGFEIAKDMKAGEQVSVTIKGARSGVFEFELHDPALKLFQVAVR